MRQKQNLMKLSATHGQLGTLPYPDEQADDSIGIGGGAPHSRRSQRLVFSIYLPEVEEGKKKYLEKSYIIGNNSVSNRTIFFLLRTA